MNTIRYFIAVILSCLMLAACGGSDEPFEDAAQTIPAPCQESPEKCR